MPVIGHVFSKFIIPKKPLKTKGFYEFEWIKNTPIFVEKKVHVGSTV